MRSFVGHASCTESCFILGSRSISPSCFRSFSPDNFHVLLHNAYHTSEKPLTLSKVSKVSGKALESGFEENLEGIILAWSSGSYRGHIICRHSAKHELTIMESKPQLVLVISQKTSGKDFRGINMLMHTTRPIRASKMGFFAQKYSKALCEG